MLVCTKLFLKKAGPFSVARLKMDLSFHNRLAYNHVHGRSASPLSLCRAIQCLYYMCQVVCAQICGACCTCSAVVCDRTPLTIMLTTSCSHCCCSFHDLCYHHRDTTTTTTITTTAATTTVNGHHPPSTDSPARCCACARSTAGCGLPSTRVYTTRSPGRSRPTSFPPAACSVDPPPKKKSKKNQKISPGVLCELV